MKLTQLKSPNGQQVAIKDIYICENKQEASIILKKDLGIEDKELCKYEVHVKGFKETYLQPRGILFQHEINYSEEMGLVVSEQLSFRCFAPTAREVSVMIFNENGHMNDGTEPSDLIPMIEVKPGLWEAKPPKKIRWVNITIT